MRGDLRIREQESEITEEIPKESSADRERQHAAAIQETPPGTESVDRQSTRGEPVAAPKHPVVTKPEYCLILVRDGDWPVLEICADIESLTKRMRTLEGEHANAFPFLGIPIPYTRGPSRFIQLPNGEPYPVFDCSEIGTFVPKPSAKLPIDMTYFLGPDMGGDQCEEPTVIDHRPVSTR